MIKVLDGFGLDKKIRAAGWNFFFLAAEEKVMFFGAIRAASVRPPRDAGATIYCVDEIEKLSGLGASASRGLAANTINQQLAAVRRLAHDTAIAQIEKLFDFLQREPESLHLPDESEPCDVIGCIEPELAHCPGRSWYKRCALVEPNRVYAELGSLRGFADLDWVSRTRRCVCHAEIIHSGPYPRVKSAFTADTASGGCGDLLAKFLPQRRLPVQMQGENGSHGHPDEPSPVDQVADDLWVPLRCAGA